MLDLLNDPELPPSEKTARRHLDEAQAVIGAGLSTIGWAATVGIYHILANPAIVARLRDELYTMMARGAKREGCTDLDWVALEALPCPPSMHTRVPPPELRHVSTKQQSNAQRSDVHRVGIVCRASPKRQ